MDKSPMDKSPLEFYKTAEAWSGADHQVTIARPYLRELCEAWEAELARQQRIEAAAREVRDELREQASEGLGFDQSLDDLADKLTAALEE